MIQRRLMVPTHKLVRVTSGLIALAAILFFAPSSSAYTTDTGGGSSGKWQNTRIVYYTVDDALNTRLVSGAKNTVINNSIAQWSNASRLAFTQVEPYSTGEDMYITAVDYYSVSMLGSCSLPSNLNTAGANCVGAHITYNSADHTDYVDKSELFLNSSANLRWCLSCSITSNGVPSPSSPWDRSVLNTSMHEISHSYILDHDSSHQEAVSWPHTANNSQVHTIQEDDKNGATQMYGPRTGWENGFANGEIDTIAFWNGLVGSYDGNIYGFPILNRTTSEQPRTDREVVYPHDGSWMERFAGCSEYAHAYAYMRLFTSANDNSVESNLRERPYLRIKSGMRLKWVQYNFQQRYFGIDFKMIDDAGNTSFFRDSGLTDTTGRSVHPAARGNLNLSIGYPPKVWFFTDVDLSPLAGRKIIEWYVAYDNGGVPFDNRPCPPFRAYFDGLRVEY